MEQEPINPPMRKGIKVAAQVAQIARLITLMPTPQDFATRIAGDIIYMSSLIQKFVTDINKVLDGYSNIPWDYFNNQLYSISDSAQNVLNRAQEYSNYVVDNTIGLAGDFVEIGAEMYDGGLDLASETAKSVSSFGAAIASTSADIKGQHDVAQSIRDGVREFQNSGNTNTNPLRDALKSVKDTETKALGTIDDTIGGAKDVVNNGVQFIQDIINKLKDMVDNMSKDVDSAFGNIINKDNISSTLGTVAQMNGDYHKAMASQVVGASAQAVQSIIDNFSLGKFVTAFMGVATNSVLISLGLDQLPPINLDKMLQEFQGSLQKTPLEGVQSDISFDDLIEYDPERYNALKESFEIYLKQQREAILAKKKNMFNVRTAEAKIYLNASKNFYNGMSKEERKNLKSAINEIKKKRKLTKKARVSRKLKDVVKEELKKLQEECSKFAKRLKEEWDAMLKTYKDAVDQIKQFFHGGGPGDQYVEDLCLDINKNVNDIVQLCTIDMPTQIAGSSTKAALPYCFGMAVPNFAHNVISFIVDVKIILKFIMDLLKYVMNILNDIKKLAQLFLIALKKLIDMIKQLLKFLGLGWLMDLVEDIVNLFRDKVDETCEILEGTLTPVYLKDLNMYPDMLNEVKKYIIELEDKNKNNQEDSDEIEPGEPVIIEQSKSEEIEDENGNTSIVFDDSGINGDPIEIYKKYIKTNSEIKKPDAIYEKLGLTRDTGFINGLLVIMGVEPIDLEEESSNGWTYWISQSFGIYLHGFFDCPTSVQRRKIKYNDKAIIQALKDRVAQIESHDSIYIAAYKTPHFSRNGISYNSSNKDLDNYDDIVFSVNTNYDPSKIDSWIYYHPNLNHYGYDIVGRTIRQNQRVKIYYNKLREVDKTMKEKYLTFMENAASTPNNEWMSKVVIKPNPIGAWSGLNINGDTSIVASEAFYWFDLTVEDDDLYNMVNPPNTPPYDDLFGDDEGEDNDDKKEKKGYVITLEVTGIDDNPKTSVSGVSIITPKKSVGYRDSFNVSGKHHVKTKVWDNVSTEEPDKFSLRCIGSKTCGIKEKHTIWKFVENASCTFNEYGMNFTNITGGELHNTSLSGLSDINDAGFSTDKIIWNNYEIDTSTISIKEDDKGNKKILYKNETDITDLVADFDGITIKFNDDLYMYNSILIYHIGDIVRIYGDTNANVINISECNIKSPGETVDIDAHIFLKGYNKEDKPEDDENSDYVSERTFKSEIKVKSKTSSSVSGLVEFTINGDEYTLTKTKSGKELDENKEWNFIPYNRHSFDVRSIGSKIGSNKYENKIKTYWSLTNGKYMFNDYEIHSGYQFNYSDFEKIKLPEEILNNYSSKETYTGIYDNKKYYTDNKAKIIIIDDIMYMFDMEKANIINLLNCQIINTESLEDVILSVDINFDGENIPDDDVNKGDDNKDDNITADILDRTIHGSVIKIWVDGETKYVFVKNQIIKEGDWILVNGKHYQAQLPK